MNRDERMHDPLRVFISYAHIDEGHRRRLDVHLAPLRREGVITFWHDRMIPPGGTWSRVIDERLADADIVLLLVSADFVASDYCYGKEMETALERHHAGEACVIPVFIKPTDFDGLPFAQLQGVPIDAKPISTWPNEDEAWLDVARGVRRAVESFSDRRTARLPYGSKAKERSGTGPIRILFIGANPASEARLALGEEVREIGRILRDSGASHDFQLIQEWAVRPDELQAIVLRHRPAIVHFSAHGQPNGELTFEGNQWEPALVPVDALGRLFEILGNSVRCVVLNACYSKAQAEAIRDRVDYVIGMNAAIKDNAAIAFSSSFYLGLARGESVETAFKIGCNQIEITGMEGSDVPVLLAKSGVDTTAVIIHRGPDPR